jgi:hypothetical protein
VYPAYKDHITSHDDINRLKPLKLNSSGSSWFISDPCFLFTILHLSAFKNKIYSIFSKLLFSTRTPSWSRTAQGIRTRKTSLITTRGLYVWLCIKKLGRFTNNKWFSMSERTSQLFDFVWLQHGLPHRVRQQLVDRDRHEGRAKGSVRDHHPTQSQILGNNRDQVSVFIFIY